MVRAFFPGSFDPIHYGHIDIAKRAVRLFDELVIAVYDKPLKSLLFTPEERIALVREAFADEPKIRVTGYRTLTVDACRDVDAQVIMWVRSGSELDQQLYADVQQWLTNTWPFHSVVYPGRNVTWSDWLDQD